MTYNFWGLQVKEEITDWGTIWWYFTINNPFELADHRHRIGINEKLLKEAIKRVVERFVIKVGQQEIKMWSPTKIMLREKKKRKEYELKPSIFENGKPMPIYYFLV